MRREDAIKNELKKLHTVYIAPYCYDSYIITGYDPINGATAFKTRKAARRYVKHMFGVDLMETDKYIRKLDFEF